MYHRSRGAHAATGAQPVSQGHEHLEEENNQAEEELRSKVSALKSLSIDIGTEVREHNRLLKDTDNEFDSAGALLQNSMKRVQTLLKSGNRYHFFYLFLFCLFVFFVLWWRI